MYDKSYLNVEKLDSLFNYEKLTKVNTLSSTYITSREIKAIC